ncbi:MAG: sensor histidine kinase [Phycisphaerales bacterium]
MTALLLFSVIARLVASVGMLFLAWRHRHASVALIALALFGATYLGGVKFSAYRAGSVAGATGATAADVVSVGVSVAAIVGVVLVSRLFRENRLLVARVGQQARRKTILLRELDHRVRNNLAGLLALIDLSAAEDPGSLTAERLRRRIRAISECHSLLARADGEPVVVGELVEMLCTANPDVPTLAAGDDLLLPMRLVQPLGMILQEMFANARKHSGIGRELGPVQLEWRVTHVEGRLLFEVEWSEPTVGIRAGALERGSGLGLIRGLAEFELGGEIVTAVSSSGLQHTLRVPLEGEECVIRRDLGNPVHMRPVRGELRVA